MGANVKLAFMVISFISILALVTSFYLNHEAKKTNAVVEEKVSASTKRNTKTNTKTVKKTKTKKAGRK